MAQLKKKKINANYLLHINFSIRLGLLGRTLRIQFQRNKIINFD